MMTPAESPPRPLPGQPTLRRVLGPSLLLFYGLGTIVGAGIYVAVGQVVTSEFALFTVTLAVSVALL